MGDPRLHPFLQLSFHSYPGSKTHKLPAQLVSELNGVVSHLAIILVCAVLLVWISSGQEKCAPTLNS